MPKTLGAAALRDKTLSVFTESNGDPIAASELQISIYGDTKDPDEHRRRQQRLRHALIALLDTKHIVKESRGYYRLNNGRPEPHVHDIPERRKYVRRNGSSNGATNGATSSDVRAYIIRDIRAKLAELEALV